MFYELTKRINFRVKTTINSCNYRGTYCQYRIAAYFMEISIDNMIATSYRLTGSDKRSANHGRLFTGKYMASTSLLTFLILAHLYDVGVHNDIGIGMRERCTGHHSKTVHVSRPVSQLGVIARYR